MKKLIAIIMVLCMVFSLSACGECEHEWQEATCDAPETCSLCDATRGEELEHDTSELDCTRCGEEINHFEIFEIDDPVAATQAKLVKREVIEDCFAYTYMSNDPGGEYINYLSGAGWTMGEIKVDYEYGTTGVPLTNGDKSMFIMTFAAKTSEGYKVLVLFEKKQFNN